MRNDGVGSNAVDITVNRQLSTPNLFVRLSAYVK